MIIKNFNLKLSVITLGLAGLYLFWLGQTFLWSVGSQEDLMAIGRLEPVVSDLEATYLRLSARIDSEAAALAGFSDSEEEIIFASRERGTVALSRDNDEI